MEVKSGSMETISTWRKELHGYLREMHEFQHDTNVEAILRKLSAFSARASYMHSQVVRSTNKEISAFRTREVDPFLRETEFQFKVWSRVSSVSQHEWEKSKF